MKTRKVIRTKDGGGVVGGGWDWGRGVCRKSMARVRKGTEERDVKDKLGKDVQN